MLATPLTEVAVGLRLPAASSSLLYESCLVPSLFATENGIRNASNFFHISQEQ